MERINRSCGRITTSRNYCCMLRHSHVLTDCVREDTKFRCVNTCESVWFKIWNVTEAGEYGEKCDKAFIGKYGNIL